MLAAALCGRAAPAVAAQCPDGAPPPCAQTRRAAARQPPPADARSRRFLLLPFRNLTRNEAHEWLVAGSPLMLADALGTLRDLTVVTPEQATAARRRLALPAGGELDAAQLRRMAEETGGWTVVTGNIVASGTLLRISSQATDALSGRVLKRAQIEVASDADIRAAYDRLAVQLLEAAGVPASTADLAALTTQSLDAFRAYVRGMTLIQESAFRRAAAAFTEAVTHDSTFGLAWARLAAALSAYNVENLLNPFSPAYRASARAAMLLPRLPPRVAVLVRAQQLFMRGQIGAARTLADSLLQAEPDHLDLLEISVAIDLLDPVLTGMNPPLRRASANRAVARTRRVLELDPGRRYAYSVIGIIYANAAGLFGGTWPAMREERGSFASMLASRPDILLTTVLRDTFEVMTDSAFRALPQTEQQWLRRRAAEAGTHWIDLWLTAGPNDADAHLWASRMSEARGDLHGALAHANTAESLGVESAIEDVSARRVTLLLYLLDFDRAGALADSLAARGALRPPLLPALDRGFASAGLALLASGRFEHAAALASRYGGTNTPTREPCEMLIHPLRRESAAPPPDSIAWAVIHRALRDSAAATAHPVLAPCIRVLRGTRPRG